MRGLAGYSRGQDKNAHTRLNMQNRNLRPAGKISKSSYLLRSSKSTAESRGSIARVSDAWMAPVEPHGWVPASLKKDAH
jgi:hypothetical protein